MDLLSRFRAFSFTFFADIFAADSISGKTCSKELIGSPARRGASDDRRSCGERYLLKIFRLKRALLDQRQAS